MRFCRLLLVLMCMGLGAGQVGALPWFFHQPVISEATWFYDLDGRAGLVYGGEVNPRSAGALPTLGNQVVGGSLEFFYVDDGEPFHIVEGFLSSSRSIHAPEDLPIGSTYYVKRIHPFFGCISTRNFVGMAYGDPPAIGTPPGIVIPYHSESQPNGFSFPDIIPPIPLEDVALPNMLLDYLTSETAVLYVAWVHIADRKTSPSLSILARESGLVDPSFTFTVTVEVNSAVIFSAQRNTHNYGGQLLVFGEGFEEMFEGEMANIHWASTSVPETITVGAVLDGYTTDTVTMDVEPGLHLYWWTPLLVPAEGTGVPYPGIAFPDSAILQRGVADQILGDCVPAATLAVAVDPNRDGVHDAADMIVGKDEEGEE